MWGYFSVAQIPGRINGGDKKGDRLLRDFSASVMVVNPSGAAIVISFMKSH
jgi:hypothetical protein